MTRISKERKVRINAALYSGTNYRHTPARKVSPQILQSKRSARRWNTPGPFRSRPKAVIKMCSTVLRAAISPVATTAAPHILPKAIRHRKIRHDVHPAGETPDGVPAGPRPEFQFHRTAKSGFAFGKQLLQRQFDLEITLALGGFNPDTGIDQTIICRTFQGRNPRRRHRRIPFAQSAAEILHPRPP